MLENFIIQVRRPKGVSGEHEAFVSRVARAVMIIVSSSRKYINIFLALSIQMEIENGIL